MVVEELLCVFWSVNVMFIGRVICEHRLLKSNVGTCFCFYLGLGVGGSLVLGGKGLGLQQRNGFWAYLSDGMTTQSKTIMWSTSTVK